MSEQPKKSFKRMPKGGYGIVQRPIMKDASLSIAAKGFYGILCSYTGDENYCFPSVAQLMQDTGLSKPTVIGYLQELEDYGVIVKSPLYPENPLKRNNKYEVLLIDYSLDSKDSLPCKVKPALPSRSSQLNLGGKAGFTRINNINNNNKKKNKRSRAQFALSYYNKVHNRKLRLTKIRKSRIDSVLKDWEIKEFLYSIHGLLDENTNTWLKKNDGASLENKTGLKRIIDPKKRDDNIEEFSRFRFKKKYKEPKLTNKKLSKKWQDFEL